MQNVNVHFIGGASGIGRWMIQNIFKQETVYCYDINEISFKGLSRSINCCLLELDQDNPYDEYSNNFVENDWLIISTPPNGLLSTINNIKPYLKSDTLIITLASVQLPAMKILQEQAPHDCQILGCHPLFGIDMFSPAGLNVALIGYRESLDQHRVFSEVLSSEGLLVSYLNAEQHDDYMSVIQALTHFTLLSFAATLSKSGYKLADLLQNKTPNYQFLYAIASRVVRLTPTTSASIQSTGGANEIRKLFLDTAVALNDMFSSCQSMHEIANTINELREPYTGADIEEGTELSIVAYAGFQRFESLLLQYLKSGKPFVFKHRVKNTYRVIRILKINHDAIEALEATTTFNDNGQTKFIIGLEDEPIRNYRTLGLCPPVPKEIEFKKKNIRLLTSDELHDFHNNLIKLISFDCNFLNPFGLKEPFFENWLPKLVRGISSCRFIDSFRKRNEIERVTLHITYYPEISRTEIMETVQSLIEEKRQYID